MKISELVELDFRDRANRLLVEEKLRQLPPFKMLTEEDNITIEMLEKFANQLAKRSPFMLGSIGFNASWNKPGYSIGYISSSTRPGTEIVVYGLDLWEIYAKSVIYIFARYKKWKAQQEGDR